MSAPATLAVQMALGGSYRRLLKTRIDAGDLDCWYRFEDSASNTVYDYSGNGVTGTLAGAGAEFQGVETLQYISAEGGTACLFDSASGDPSLTATFPASTTTFTLEFWLAPNTPSGVGTLLTNDTDVAFYLGGANNRTPDFVFSATSHQASSELSNGVLAHLVLVVSSGNGTFYINGASAGTFSGFGGFTPARMGRLGASTNPLRAYIDEFAYYVGYAMDAATVAAHYAAGVWTDITSDVNWNTPVRWAWGITDNGPLDRLAAPSRLSFTVNNSATATRALGSYSPQHASVRSGFTFGVLCRVVITTGGTSYQRFVGRVRTISPQPQWDQFVDVVVMDLMTDLHEIQVRDVALIQDDTEAAVVRALIRSLPITSQPLALNIAQGLDSHPYAFDKLGAGQAAAIVLGALAESALGYISMSPLGALRTENRNTRPLTAPTVTFSDVGGEAQGFTHLVVPSTLDHVYNQVEITYHPIEEGASTEVLWSQEGAALPIQSGQTIHVGGDYFDPNENAKAIGGLNPITPLVTTTDYTANSNKLGSGSNRTTDITVTNETAWASFWGADFTNGHANKAWLTKAQIRGTALRDKSPVTVYASSVQPYGVRILEADFPFETDGVLAQQKANYLLTQCEQLGSQLDTISFIPSRHTTLMSAAMTVEIGTGVTITEAVTGISGRDAYVQRVECVYAHDTLRTTLGLQVLYPYEFIAPPEESPDPTFAATGGTITTSGGFTIHTFTTSGTFSVSAGSANVDYLVVAGGGGGGSTGAGEGGGGGGGVKAGSTTVDSGTGNYTITVGTGGAAGNNGNNSSAFGTTATGGGKGGNGGGNGSSGGSGGGGGDQGNGASGISGQGYAGGDGTSSGCADAVDTYAGGGGGGANGPGGDGNDGGYPTCNQDDAGDGGPGRASSISGTSVKYGGGGGGTSLNGTNGSGGSGGGGNGGQAGTDGRGGGGGGGAAGGDGVVIVRYTTPV